MLLSLAILFLAAGDPISDIAGLGTAGVIGSIWLLERRLVHRRERQLDQAHNRIVQEEAAHRELVRVVRINTQATTITTQRLEQLTESIKRLTEHLDEGGSA